jgi:hypothetical protein
MVVMFESSVDTNFKHEIRSMDDRPHLLLRRHSPMQHAIYCAFG